MGAVIAWGDSASRISPVNPMPTPDNNILVALQSVVAGAMTDTAIKTIARNAGNLLQDIYILNICRDD